MDLIKGSDELIKNGIKLDLPYITFEGILVEKKHSRILEEYILRVKNKIEKEYTIEALKNNETVRLFRDFYWHYLNIDPTKTRPSSEALIRRILAKNPIPQVNNIVDLNNWVSIETLIPLGAYDLDLLKTPLILRFAKPGEEFVPIGSSKKILNGKEIIIADETGLIIHQYPHRDSDLCKITNKTRNMLVTACGVPGLNHQKLLDALVIFRDNLKNASEKSLISSKIITLSN